MSTFEDLEVVPAAENLMDVTYRSLIGPWMDNFANNLSKVRKGFDIQGLPKKEGPILLVGGGPSVERFRQLSKIAKAGWRHPILCCDRVLNKCLKQGLKPDVVASVDGSPLVANYYSGKLVRKACKSINAAFCVTVHPKTVKAWKGDIYWFVAMIDNLFIADKETPGMQLLNHKSVTYILDLLSGGKGMISALGNVGAFLVNLAAELGNSPICVSGDALLFSNPKAILLKDIKIGDKVLGRDGYGTVLEKKFTGYEPVLQIRTSSRKIKATKNHKLLALRTLPKQYYKLTLSGKQKIISAADRQKVSLKHMRMSAKISETHLYYWLNGQKALNENAVITIFSVLGLPVSDIVDSSKDKNGHVNKLIKKMVWTPISQLKKGDLIAILKENLFTSPQYSFGIDLAWLIGVFCGDGYSARIEKTKTWQVTHRVHFCVPEREKHAVRIKLVNILNKNGYKFTEHKITVNCYQKKLYDFFASLGLNVKSVNRTVPNLIWSLSKEEKIAFIAGYIDADGCLDGGAKVSSRSKSLLENTRMLCIDVGFKVENIVTHEQKGEIFNGKRWYHDEGIIYSFRIQNSAMQSLKNYSVKAFSANVTSRHTDYKFAIKTWNMNLPQHLAFDIIREIKEVGFDNVYDIQVDKQESFFADGVLTHNCLIGYDYSERVQYKEQSVYWNKYVAMFQKSGLSLEEAQQKTSLLHQVERNPDFNTFHLVNPIWKSYRRTLAAFITASQLQVINATGAGCLHTQAQNMKGEPLFGSNFLAMKLEDVLKKF